MCGEDRALRNPLRETRSIPSQVTFDVSGKELAAPIAGKGIDRNDGSYTCIYTVPARGNYSLDIKMDDVPIQVRPPPSESSAAVPLAPSPNP